MHPEGFFMRTEDLLAHADFIRALARSLVLDEHRAQDVTQETWLAALKHPPLSGGALRSWLARVTRNFAYKQHRSETRRSKHEMESPRVEGIPSPEEIAEREETRRHMVDALLGLDEPYRITLLLRFYEDISVRDVAQKLDLPEDTVRTRLRRGLDMMRSRLDARYGRDRMRWGLALAPLAGVRIDAASAATAAAEGTTASVTAGATASATAGATTWASGTWISGVILMTATSKAAIVSILLLLTATVTILQFLDDSVDNGDMPPQEIAVATGTATLATIEEEPEEIAVDEPTQTEAPEAEEELVKETMAPEKAVILGRVIEKESGEPVCAYEVCIPVFTTDGTEFIAEQSVRREDGRFVLKLDDEGEYRIWVRTADYVIKMVQGVAARTGTAEEMVIELEKGFVINGYVVDEVTGLPIEGAVVMPWDHNFNHAGFFYARVIAGEDQLVNLAKSDEDGRFSLSGQRGDSCKVAVLHPDYLANSIRISTEKETVIELKASGFRISGTVLDSNGMPAEGMAVYTNTKAMTLSRPIFTDETGYYCTAPFPPGVVYLVADPGHSPDLENENGIKEMKRVHLENRDVQVDFGPSDAHVTWTGTFYDEEGEPVPDGKIILYPADMSHISSVWMNTQLTCRSDEAGAFRLPHILPGEYRLTIHSEAHRYRDCEKIVFDRPGEFVQDIRLSESQFTGVVVDAETNEPITNKPGQLIATSVKTGMLGGTSSINDKGRFAIKELEPGYYNLSVNMIGYTGYRKVATLHIEADEMVCDYILPINPGGTVSMKVKGFDPDDQRTFMVQFHEKDGTTVTWPLSKRTTETEVSASSIYNMTAGEWSAALSFADLGFAEKHFVIEAGKTTEVVIRKEDFSRCPMPVRLSGLLRYHDGTPIENADLRFAKYYQYYHDDDACVITGSTDSEGAFTLDGFLPGYWLTYVELPSGQTLVLPKMVLPGECPNPYAIDLVLSDNTVKGRLSFGRSEHAARQRVPAKISLYSLKKERVCGVLSAFEGEGRFELRHIPDGEYDVRIAIPGYENHITKRFSVRGGKTKDVGEIVLKPCNSLILCVKDKAGEVVDDFKIHINDQRLSILSHTALENGRYAYNDLPEGEVSIRIEVEGHPEKRQTVTLDKEGMHEVTIEL